MAAPTPTLTPIHARPFQSEGDYEAMRHLVVDVLAHTGPPVYATIGNLDWWRAAEDDPRGVYNARLWFAGPERLVAFAWPVDDQVDIVVHPDFPALHAAALAWAEEHFRPAPTFRAWAFTGDAARIAALTARGYRRTEKGLVTYGQATRPSPNPSRWAGDSAAAPSLPPGYTIRPVRGPEESEARAAVQRLAFESEWMTAAHHARVRSSPTYRPELDLVIEAPGGELAGFALLWLDAANRLGVFEPLGVAVAYQRRGLGRTLMMAGLHRLHDHGADYALVETGLDSKARSLYEATGFTLLDTNFAWVSPNSQCALAP